MTQRISGFAKFWSSVIRFTPVALFLVVLTFVASQAHLANYATVMTEHGTANVAGSDGETFIDDDEAYLVTLEHADLPTDHEYDDVRVEYKDHISYEGGYDTVYEVRIENEHEFVIESVVDAETGDVMEYWYIDTSDDDDDDEDDNDEEEDEDDDEDEDDEEDIYTDDEVIQKVMIHAGLSTNLQFEEMDADLEDRSDGSLYYEVRIENSGEWVIEAIVDAVTGEIDEYVKEYFENDDDDDEDDEEDEDEDEPVGTRELTANQALDIVLERVGLVRTDVDHDKVKYDADDNVYEVKFTSGILKVEAVVNAYDGDIMEIEKELDEEGEDEEDDDAELAAYLSEFPASQQKMLRKLLLAAGTQDMGAVFELVLELDVSVRDDLLKPNEKNNNNRFFAHAKRVLKKKGVGALAEFLLSEDDLHDTIEETEQVKRLSKIGDRLEAVIDRIENFTFPATLGRIVVSKLQSLIGTIELGTLGQTQLVEFDEELDDLIDQAKEKKVKDGVIPFVDVDPSEDESPSADFVEDIIYLKDKGITTGFDDGKYHGDKVITRAGYVAMILRAQYGVVGVQQELAHVDMSVLPDDVPRNSSLARLVALAYEKGVTKATNNFGFSRPVSRAEAMVIAARAFDVVVTEDIRSHFDDTRGFNSEFNRVINKAAEDGIVSGQNGKFRPSDSIRRDEAARVIHRATLLWLENND